ncbi:M48 family metallopeptidase [Candidatus Poribacteria bacterium]|jgi:predicted metal-dependent hydrolase|nr:M48 family metallopeptidase [Candidatus Poribacteria bacterium]MBT5531693.1 M48 family metallopeptidase [Candidatus Poribacteria bacterium]MBT7096310.1 M48 family metallopeptidase [Candidatus Poribacteria bacterium]MBT7804963.1 M48 family metallopeptidase [Candidatus Poribacteria bacterium]
MPRTGDPKVRVTRSARRKKTVAARWDGDVVEILAPAHMPERELQDVIDKLTSRLTKKRARKAGLSDDDLARRAQRLNREYFEGRLRFESIRFVTNQNQRFGSCTPAHGTIRLSERLRRYPEWVLDYVVVHELAHLIHPNHAPDFWEVVNRYPLTERARGFLIAVSLVEDEVDSVGEEGAPEDTG